MAEPVTAGLLVRIEALPGREKDVEDFLQHALTLAGEERNTIRWFALRFGPSSFGIYDAFPDDSGRQAHLSGQVAQALAENVGTLFEAPVIEPVDVLGEKPPI
jgi:hypothetical protein